jgi:drug/metabolite transporter (DMT)-like permease
MPRTVFGANTPFCWTVGSSTTATAMTVAAEALCGALAGAWLLGEQLDRTGMAGCLLVIAGIVLMQLDIPAAIGRLTSRRSRGC